VDPDDKTALASHVQFYKHELLHFYKDTRLDEIFKRFLDGKCHLAVIQQIFIDDKGKEKINKAVGKPFIRKLCLYNIDVNQILF